MSTTNKLLITGASGFLGRHIADQAVAADIDVRCTGRSKTPPFPVTNYQSADLTDSSSVRPLFDGVESVIHSAGLAHQFGKQDDIKQRFHAINVNATTNVVQAAVDANVANFVLVSSVSVYGTQSDSPVMETARCQPVGPYARSKWLAEQGAIDIARKSDMRLTILRMATIYGAGDPGNVLKLMRTIDRGRFVWVGRGQNMKSLIHVNDAAAACLRPITSPSKDETHKIYNVSATPETMNAIVHNIGNSLGQPVRRWHIPASLPLTATAIVGRVTPAGSFVRRVNGTLTKWIANDAYDGSRFCDDYNFEPAIPLTDGIQNEVDWYRKAA